MTTARDIVEGAFRKIGILTHDQALSADEFEEGLRALNYMIAGWRILGVNVALETLAADDPWPFQPEFEEGAIWQLAGRLSPDYQRPPVETEMFLRAMQAHTVIMAEAEMPSALRRTPSQMNRFHT